MNRISIGLFFTVILFAAPLRSQSRDALSLAVSSAPGWSPAGRSVYNRDQIDRLDSTLAPVLKRYGVRGVTLETWTGTHGHLTASVFEMNDSAAAYGLMTALRSANPADYAVFPFGAEGYRLNQQAIFWQGSFVIKLEGDPAAMDAWAGLVAPHISGPSLKAPVTEQLPTEGRIEHTDRYVVSAADLDDIWAPGRESLGFESSAEAATAEYKVHGKPLRLLLIMYPTPQVAKRYDEGLKTVSALGFRKREGTLLAIVEPGADPAAAETLLAAVRHEYQVTWNERRPGPTLPQVMLTIFTFIGIALAFTFVAGVGFGGIRVFVKSRYPGRVFDRPEDVEVIQLKLNQSVMGGRDDPRAGSPQHPAG
ncbi:MAG TPA: DUF6599 family protein [Terriglobia bacterium]|nr:DUF6599 family protein [Terriglobia bacterium]